MPIPVQIFLVSFTLVLIALPVLALRAHRGGRLDDMGLTLSWIALAAWVVTPLIVTISGQTPPSRLTSGLLALILLCGMAAAVAVGRAKNAPRLTRSVAWACALGLLLRAAFAGVAATVLLHP